MKRANRTATAATSVLLVAALATGAALYIYKDRLLAFASAPFKKGSTVTVVIPQGAGPKRVAEILEARGVIGDATLFYRWVKFVARKQADLKAGEYELSPGMSPEEIVALLEVGRDAAVKVTIPEGLRKEEVADIVAGAGLSSKEALLTRMNATETVDTFGVPSTGAGGQATVPGGIEGYLFPDTYLFARNAPPDKILRRMRARLDEVIDERMEARMVELGWNLHKVLTLAAIIEKETGDADERPHISAVFHNRLKRGMRLQTDPTVIYGIPDFDGDIRRDDLQRDQPYNTYVIPGLPPGPIAQPGLAAIRAALWPSEDSDDLYFVAKGHSGEHQFCPTLECHNAAVRHWQLERRRKKG